MTAWTVRHAAATDRRRSAVHEAGHFVVAMHVGIVAPEANIWPVTVSDFRKETTWAGHAQFFNRRADGERPSPAENALVAVAGAVAEFAWKRETFFDTCDNGLWHEPDIMSASDWAMTGCQPGEPTDFLFDTIEAAFNLLGAGNGILWADLVKQSRLLIVDSRVFGKASGGNPVAI